MDLIALAALTLIVSKQLRRLHVYILIRENRGPTYTNIITTDTYEHNHTIVRRKGETNKGRHECASITGNKEVLEQELRIKGKESLPLL